MAITAKQTDIINVKQYVIDKQGNKLAAILDMEELARVRDLLEGLSDLKAIENRVNEPAEDYEKYSRKRKSSLHV